jgi:cytidylate kinase
MNIRNLSLSLAEALLRSASAPGTEEEASQAAPKRPPFTIAISREVGALGTSVGAELGKRLGWAVYDQEIIHKIADELGQPARDVRELDERHISWLEEVLLGMSSKYSVTPTAYLKKLVGTIRGLGLVGHCIIVGRGGSFILPPESTLRVRLVADLADRVRNIGRLRRTSDREAVRWVEQTEASRAQFVKDHFGKDVADPHHYDLVLNLSILSVPAAAEIILAALRAREQPAPAEAEDVSRLTGAAS